MTMQTTLYGGPQDGLSLRVPPDCLELRFPVVIDPGFIAQFRANALNTEMLTMKASIYVRMGSTFHYQGDM